MRLQPFPDSPPFAQTLTVSVNLSRQCEGFVLEHCLEGPGVDGVLLAPPATAPACRDELWKHTCMEAFFAVSGSTGYYEFNGSPSGDWALYRFDDYRQGMRVQSVMAAPTLQLREQKPGVLRLVWHIPFFCNDALDRAGITAVLQHKDQPGVSSYWALAHVGGKPDFHLAGSFVCPLPI